MLEGRDMSPQTGTITQIGSKNLSKPRYQHIHAIREHDQEMTNYSLCMRAFNCTRIPSGLRQHLMHLWPLVQCYVWIFWWSLVRSESYSVLRLKINLQSAMAKCLMLFERLARDGQLAQH